MELTTGVKAEFSTITSLHVYCVKQDDIKDLVGQVPVQDILDLQQQVKDLVRARPLQELPPV